MSEGDTRADTDGAAASEFDRRQFLKSMGVMATGGILADLGLFDEMAGATSLRRAQAAEHHRAARR